MRSGILRCWSTDMQVRRWLVFALLVGSAHHETRVGAVEQTSGRGRQGDEPISVASDLVCAGVGAQSRLAPTGMGPFASRKALRLAITSADRSFDADSRLALASEIARTITIWRAICPACISGNLAVIELADGLYVDTALATFLKDVGPDTKWVGGIPRAGSAVNATKSEANFTSLIGLLSPRWGPRGTTPSYQGVARDAPWIKAFCSSDSQSLPADVRDMQEAFPCGPRDAHKSAAMQLHIVDGPTSCGASTNIVGCSADSLLVELNARDYQFKDHVNGTPVFGASTGKAVDLLVVLLHEVGHWMGLPHLADDGDLMGDSLVNARCISRAAVESLNARITDPKAPLPRYGALYYSRP